MVQLLLVVGLFVFLIVPASIAVTLCVLPAIWFVWGETDGVLRTLGLLAFAGGLGLACDTIEHGQGVVGLCVIAGGGICLVANVVEMTSFSRLLACLFGLLLLWFSWRATWTFVTGTSGLWGARVTLAMLGIAGLMVPARIFGVRVVNLTRGVSSREIELETGRDWDEWFALLERGDGARKSSAALRALVQSYGISPERQLDIVNAYERAYGRRPIGSSGSRRKAWVNSIAALQWDELLAHPLRQQFTLRRLLGWTSAAALLSWYLRTLAGAKLSQIDLRYGIPLVVAIAAISGSAIHAALAVRWDGRKLRTSAAAAMIAGLALPWSVYVHPWWRPWAVPTALTVFGIQVACLILARHRGYRCVLVRKTRAEGIDLPESP
ncbi:MAG: hypothetical protein AB7F89_14475 [Pirellulaceae bacterium]